MAQIFHRGMNTVARASVFGALFIVAGLSWSGLILARSAYLTATRVVREQPIPFSHEDHVGQLGIDCRYCHPSVETAAYAGMPATKTCMNCHSQIWVGSAMLAPVRSSYRDDVPIQWQRVHNLPDFAYFDHSIHVNKGVGCVECHGRVDRMPLMWQEHTLLMEWCLDCHRDPAPHVRPRAQVFQLDAPPVDLVKGQELLELYRIRNQTHCSACHR